MSAEPYNAPLAIDFEVDLSRSGGMIHWFWYKRIMHA